jgi:hypothetical protein
MQLDFPAMGISHNQLLSAEEQRMVDIQHPHHHDVLCGRGVTTNRHPGNESFRSLVGLNKVSFLLCFASWRKFRIPLATDKPVKSETRGKGIFPFGNIVH